MNIIERFEIIKSNAKRLKKITKKELNTLKGYKVIDGNEEDEIELSDEVLNFLKNGK